MGVCGVGGGCVCGVYGGRMGWGVGEVECVCVGGGVIF